MLRCVICYEWQIYHIPIYSPLCYEFSIYLSHLNFHDVGQRQLHRQQRHGMDAVRGGQEQEEAGAKGAARHQFVLTLPQCDATRGRARGQHGRHAYRQQRYTILL